MQQRIKNVEEEEKKEQEKYTAPTLLNLIAEKDKQLLAQAEDIGRLKEQIRQMTIEKEKHVLDADTSNIASAG